MAHPAHSPRPKRVVQNRKPAKKKVKSKAEKTFDLILTIEGIGMIVGAILILVYFPDTIVSLNTVFSLIIILGLLAMAAVLPVALKKNKKGVTYLKNIGVPFFVGISLLGGGSLLTGLTMSLNTLGKSSEPTVEIHKVAGRDKKYKISTYSGVVYQLEKNALEEEVDLRWFELTDNYYIKQKGYIQYEISDGLFGMRVFESRGTVTDTLGTDYKAIETLGDGY